MNYKLLPPRPDISDAMSILNIPNSPSGFKQILQHVAYDGLGLFIPVVKDLIKSTDDRIIKKEILGMEVIEIDSSKINPHTSWQENQVERLVGFCKVGRCSVAKMHNSEDYLLRVDSFIHNSLEYYTLESVSKFSEELREEKLKEFPNIAEIEDDEGLLAESERLGEYVDSYKIGHSIPNLNRAYFDRQELIEFAESFNDVGVIKNSQAQEPSLVDESLNKTALKVIGLLMLHLNKGKYTNNGKPNRSQLKGLLLELASKHNIKNYGLDSADERILKRAWDYIEEQKIDEPDF